MTTVEKEYIEARQVWAKALKDEGAAKIATTSARYRFTLARDALRAEERDLLSENVIVPTSGTTATA